MRDGLHSDRESNGANVVLSSWTKIISKTSRKKNAPIGKLDDIYEDRAPSYQNAIDLIPGWSSMFPAELELRAGSNGGLFHDERIRWAIDRFGDLADRSVLELGPLEGAHTSMLSKAGARVDAIEANQLAYFKCLITKEIMDIKNARFLLGDCTLWLEQNDKMYDLIVACGVLYHMREPLRLLQAMSRRTDSIYLWTVFINDDALRPTDVVKFNNIDVRLYWVSYGERSSEFCGGPIDHANWMHRDDIVPVIKSLGYTDIALAHEENVVPKNRHPAFSVFARRPIAP